MSDILIVIDMQNDFIGGSLGTAEARGIVKNVAAKVKNFNGLVLATQDSHQEKYLDTMEGKNLPVKHCLMGTWGWELHDDVKAALGEHCRPFVKYTFASTDLVEELCILDKKKRIEEVTLVGLCTDICVISNALVLKAFLPETKITVDASCCAGVTLQSHTNALNAMKMCQINVIE